MLMTAQTSLVPWTAGPTDALPTLRPTSSLLADSVHGLDWKSGAQHTRFLYLHSVLDCTS